MTYVVAASIVGGANLLGAGIGAYSSNSAAKESRKGYEKGLARQEELQAPFREAGLAAQNRLLQYMGLTTERYDGGNQDQTLANEFNKLGIKGKQYQTLANGLNNLGLKGEPSSRTGMDPNAEGFGKYTHDFGASDFQADPGYQFRLKEGLKELDRKAGMHGGSLGGNALRAGQEYAQNMASNEYQNAFNRYQVNRANQLQPLQSMMGAGQTSSNILSDASGRAYQGMGDARASGYIGMGNAINQGIGGFTNYYQNQNMLDAYNKRTGMGDYNTSPTAGGIV